MTLHRNAGPLSAAFCSFLLLCVSPASGSAQSRLSFTDSLFSLAPFPTVDPDGADHARLSNLLEGKTVPLTPRNEWRYDGLLREASSLTYGSETEVRGTRVTVFSPFVRTLWNSDLPSTQNEGSLWAGRGLNLEAGAGIRIDAGPLRVILAPKVSHSENRSIDVLQVIPYYPPDLYPPFIPLWYREGVGIDMPIRLGTESMTRVDAGESSVSLRLGSVTLGGGTESHWWGPGMRNGIVMSTNAPGFPHLFVRPSAPVSTPIGVVDGRWLLGSLETSPYFLGGSRDDDRAIGAFAITLQPAPAPNLTLGLARSLYGPTDEENSAFSIGHGVLTRWRGLRSVHIEGRPPHDQVFSLFGRWVLPEVGAEIYGEWARTEMPDNVRDFLIHPNHSQGYTMGLQWTRPALSGLVRLQAEVTNLEMATTFRTGRTTSFYVSQAGGQGYTNQGRVIGAGIGPGSSAQSLGVDFFRDRWSIGLYGWRTRWDNDAFYTSNWAQLWGVPYHSHDVSVTGGLRGGWEAGLMRISAEYSAENRMNYLFQNWSVDWAGAPHLAVNVVNHRFKLYVTPLLP